MVPGPPTPAAPRGPFVRGVLLLCGWGCLPVNEEINPGRLRTRPHVQGLRPERAGERVERGGRAYLLRELPPPRGWGGVPVFCLHNGNWQSYPFKWHEPPGPGRVRLAATVCRFKPFPPQLACSWGVRRAVLRLPCLLPSTFSVLCSEHPGPCRKALGAFAHGSGAGCPAA